MAGGAGTRKERGAICELQCAGVAGGDLLQACDESGCGGGSSHLHKE